MAPLPLPPLPEGEGATGRPGSTRSACAARTPHPTPPPLHGAGPGGEVTHATNPSVMCTVQLTSLKPCLKQGMTLLTFICMAV